MAFIDGTAVNVALPALQTALHATVQDMQWVVEAYALLLASLLLVDRDQPEFAGMQTSDLCIRRAIDQAFLSGYRDVIWISVGLAILSALSAQMIGPKD